jgi:hypothetical protein
VTQAITLTPALAYASGQDAGNRSMRAAGRTHWNLEDWNVAAEVTTRLLCHALELPEAQRAQIERHA